MEPIQQDQSQDQPQEAFTLEQLQEEVVKVCRSAHNENVKETKIKAAFEKYATYTGLISEEHKKGTVITVNPAYITGNPDTANAITINAPEGVTGNQGPEDVDPLRMGQNVVTK